MRGVEGLGPVFPKLGDLLLAFRAQRCLQISIALQQLTNRIDIADLTQQLLYLLQRGQPLLQLWAIERPEHLQRITEPFGPHAKTMQLGGRFMALHHLRPLEVFFGELGKVRAASAAAESRRFHFT